MFFDVWKAYKEICGGPTLCREQRTDILVALEERVRESERGRMKDALEQLGAPKFLAKVREGKW